MIYLNKIEHKVLEDIETSIEQASSIDGHENRALADAIAASNHFQQCLQTASSPRALYESATKLAAAAMRFASANVPVPDCEDCEDTGMYCDGWKSYPCHCIIGRAQEGSS